MDAFKPSLRRSGNKQMAFIDQKLNFSSEFLCVIFSLLKKHRSGDINTVSLTALGKERKTMKTKKR